MLAAHIILSVGWLGAVVAYLTVAIVGLISRDAQTVLAAYLSMEVIGWFVIVAFSLTLLLVGLVESLSTPWGLVSTVVGLDEVPIYNGATHRLARAHASSDSYGNRTGRYDFVSQRFPHAADSTRGPRCGRLVGIALGNGAVALQAVGMTPYALRMQHERNKVLPADLPSVLNPTAGILESTAKTPRRWCPWSGSTPSAWFCSS